MFFNTSKCVANYVISWEVYDDFKGQKILAGKSATRRLSVFCDLVSNKAKMLMKIIMELLFQPTIHLLFLFFPSYAFRASLNTKREKREGNKGADGRERQ